MAQAGREGLRKRQFFSEAFVEIEFEQHENWEPGNLGLGTKILMLLVVKL